MRTKNALAGLMVQKKRIGRIHNFDTMDISPLFLQFKYQQKLLKLKFGYMSPSGQAVSIMK